jgi:hypothetical protein
MKYNSPFFTCGPFVSASMGIDEFATNMYFTYLFQDSLNQQKTMKAEIDVLPETEEEEIVSKKAQLDYLEAIFQLQLSLSEDPEMES